MKRKTLLELTALLFSIVMVVTLIPSAGIRADDTKTVDGYVFTKNEEGFYEASIKAGEYTNEDTYYLLDQDLIDNKFGGTMPYYVFSEENMATTVLFYQGEDIKITKPLVNPYHSAILIEMQGREISYEPAEGPDAGYMWDGATNAPCYLCLRNNYDIQNDSFIPDSNGTVKSLSGAPLFAIGSLDYRSSSVDIWDVDLIGGYKTHYTNTYGRAVTILGNGNFAAAYAGNGCTISNFSSQKGGAIYVEGFSYSPYNMYGGNVSLTCCTIKDCYAVEGGAIYSEGTVNLNGVVNEGKYTEIKNCSAKYRGGAICMDGPYCQLKINSNTKITDNECSCIQTIDMGGGGIYLKNTSSDPSAKCIIDGELIMSGNKDLTGAGNFYMVNNGATYGYIYVSDARRLGNSNIGLSLHGYSSGDIIINAKNVYSTGSSLTDLNEDFYMEYNTDTLLPGKKGDTNEVNRLFIAGDGTFPVTLRGYTLLTGGEAIGIKFHVYMPENEALGSEDNNIWTAKVSAAGNNELYIRGKNEQYLTLDKYERTGDCVTFTYYVDSVDMTVPLMFDLYKAGCDEPVFSMSGFKVRDYIDAVCKDYRKYGLYDDNGAIALALYGAAAQKYFGFRVTDLADKNITEDMKASVALDEWETKYITTTDYSPDYGNMPFSIPAGEHASFYGWTMNFGGKLSVKYYFKLAEGADPSKVDLTASWTDPSKVSISKVSGSYYCVKISDLSMSALFNSTLIRFNYDGVTEMEFYSRPINYATRIYNAAEGTYSSEAVNLVYALYTYARNHY